MSLLPCSAPRLFTGKVAFSSFPGEAGARLAAAGAQSGAQFLLGVQCSPKTVCLLLLLTLTTKVPGEMEAGSGDPDGLDVGGPPAEARQATGRRGRRAELELSSGVSGPLSGPYTQDLRTLECD